MKNKIDLQKYLQLNATYDKIYVYKFGDEAGFFSEYNNLVFAIIWCLLHHYQFVLQSKNANFSKAGWNTFFKPFIEERYDEFLNIQNRRYINPIQPYYDQYKIKNPNIHFMFEHFNELAPFVDNLREKNTEIEIKELNFKGNSKELCGAINEMIWHYNEKMENIKQQFIKALRLPDEYVSLHIRLGDKYLEHPLHDPDEYMAELRKYSSCKDVFVLTDDYSAILKLKEKYQDYNFYTLCMKDENGYSMIKYLRMTPTQRLTALARLITSLDIILNSQEFIGTYSNNPTVFNGYRMDAEKMHCLDYAYWKI